MGGFQVLRKWLVFLRETHHFSKPGVLLGLGWGWGLWLGVLTRNGEMLSLRSCAVFVIDAPEIS